MNIIKYFIYFTTILTIFGCLVLLNDGNFDIYAFWNLCTLLVASYYVMKHEEKK